MDTIRAKISRIMLSAVLACSLGIVGVAGLTAATPSEAQAAQAYVGGGTWQYGTSATWAWSNYWHTSKAHSSSLVHSMGTNWSQIKGPNAWSYCEMMRTDWRTISCYWRTY